jgi:hypothetical protein
MHSGWSQASATHEMADASDELPSRADDLYKHEAPRRIDNIVGRASLIVE